MTPPVGRLLRALRSARGVSVEEASAGADIPVTRLRRLERGAASLEYLEGIRLAKTLDLCPTCFRKLFEAATEREALALEGETLRRNDDEELPTPRRAEVLVPIGNRQQDAAKKETKL